MKTSNRSITVAWQAAAWILLSAAFLATESSAESSVIADRHFAVHEEGLQLLGMENDGVYANPHALALNLPELEYPGGSLTVFLYSGGLWVGGLKDGVPIVSTCVDGNNGTREFGGMEFASAEDLAALEGTSIGWLEKTTNPVTTDDQADRKEFGRYDGEVGRAYLSIGQKGRDDDGDGLIDEDPAGDISRDYIDNDGDGVCDGADPDYDGDAVVGSLDDDGDGLFDEDDSAVAGQELICAFVDTCETCLESPDIDGFVPLGVRVVQHSYQWRESCTDDLIIFDFCVTNIGEETLEDICIGTFFDFQVWNLTQHAPGEDDVTYFDEALGMAIGTDFYHWNDELLAAQYFGVRIIESPVAEAAMTYRPYSRLFGERDPVDNIEKYAVMSSGVIAPDGLTPSDWRFLLTLGPLGDLDSGNSMNAAFAVVNGVEAEDLVIHAEMAKRFWDMGLAGPEAPDSPEFVLEPGNRTVKIRWKSNAEQSRDRLTETFDFQGYNVWRTPDGETWTLVETYDLPDTVGGNSGWPPAASSDDRFDYELDDTGLMNGAMLTYVVTAFDDGDNCDGIHTEQWDLQHGGVGVLESGRGEDVQQIAIPAEAAQAEGDIDNVFVVPNPYIGSSRLEQHGWSEGVGRIEFRGLPPEYEIQIYTLAGDLVRELRHDNGLSWESWDVRNDEGGEVAGGIYIVRVVSAGNERIGKFLIVK